MAGIFAHVEDDISNLRKLKAEIEDIKKALKGINVTVDINIKDGLEAQLKSLSEQYNVLAQKITASEGKVVQSINNINKATERIVEAQNKATQTAQQADGNTSVGASSGVESQVKAYGDLNAEIVKVLGTREENIRKLTEEQHIISLLKKQIKGLNDEWLENGALNESQRILLDRYNAELLEHQTTVANVQQVMRNEVKINQATAGSMQQLAQELARMRIAYRTLTDEQKNSPFGADLLASIELADQQIKDLDASIGNHQRNVGNYASGWNGLNMSIQQLAREMPALAYGPQIFFSAISNNLPILTDEIKRAKDEFARLKAAGQSATPVWKQIVTSLVSWQTALTVGITLVTLYGKEITNWVASLFNADSALKELEESMKKRSNELNKSFSESVGQSAGKMRAEYEEMRRLWNELDSEAEKVKFIKKHADDIRTFGYEVNNITQAEDLFNKNTDKVVASFEARARAAAASDMIVKVWQDYYTQLDKIEKDHEKRLKENVSTASRNTLPSTGMTPTTEMGVGIAGDDPYTASAKAVKAIADAREATRKETEEMLKTAEQNREKELKKYQKERKKGLEGFGGSGSKVLDGDERAKAEEKRAEILLKIEQDNASALVDLEEDTQKKRLTVIQNNFNKRKSEIEKQAKELAEQNKKAGITTGLNENGLTSEQQTVINTANSLNKQNQQKQIKEIFKEEEKAMWDFLSEYGTYHEQKLAITKSYAQKIKEAATSGERQSLIVQRDKSLKELRNTNLKKGPDWNYVFGGVAKKSIQGLEEARELILDMLKNNEDLSETDMTALYKQYVELGKTIEDSKFSFLEFIGLKSRDKKQVEKLNTEYEDLQTIVNDVFDGRKQKAQNKLNEAQSDLADFISETTGESYSGTLDSRELVNILINSNASSEAFQKFELLSSAVSTAKKDVEAVGAAAANAGGAMKGAAEAVGAAATNAGGAATSLAITDAIIHGVNDNIQSLVKLMEELGLEETKAGKAISKFAESSQYATAGWESLKKGDVMGVALNVLGSLRTLGDFLGQLGIGGFGESDVNLDERLEQLALANDALRESIEMLSNDLKNANFTEASQIYQEQLANLLKAEANTRESMQRSASAWSNGFLGIGGTKSSESKVTDELTMNEWRRISALVGKQIDSGSEFFSLSAEEMRKIAKEAPDIWAKIKQVANDGYKDAAQYMDIYIAYGEELEALQGAFNEKMTGISFDSFRDEFKSILTDMEMSAKDFGEKFEDIMVNAIVESLMTSKYDDAIQSLYDNFVTYAEDGFTQGELAKIEAEKKAIYDSMQQDREYIEMLKGSSTSLEASGKGIASLTQEQGEQLNGRFTALQMAGEAIQAQNDIQTEQITLLNMTSTDIKNYTAKIDNSLLGIADQISQSYAELQSINDNTAKAASSLQKVESRLKKIEEYTSNLQ